jgi:hypothetical protein
MAQTHDKEKAHGATAIGKWVFVVVWSSLPAVNKKRRG